MSLNAILCDLDLCIGCYACEVACKQENNVPEGTRWIRVAPIGPEKVDGKMRMDFIPMMTDKCTLCRRRLKENPEPACVASCPTRALLFCDNAYEVLATLQNGRRMQLCKVYGELPAYG